MIIKNQKIKQNGSYRFLISTRSRITTELGRIKKKNDGRFEWTRWGSIFYPYWNNGEKSSQGVCNTREEAVENLLHGWNIN